MKRCLKCGEEKSLEKFSLIKRRGDKYRSQCKECHNKYKNKYRKENKDKVILWRKTFNEKHPGWFKKRQSEFYKKNKQRIIDYSNNYNQTKDDGLLYKYLSIHRRCEYKSQRGYKWYGGRGIKCEWKSYQDFKYDMYGSYIDSLKKNGHKNTTLDRIDPNGNYCKQNCRWADIKTQLKNRRPNSRAKKYNGETSYVASSRLGGERTLVVGRIKKGWSVEKAFTTPKRGYIIT